MTATSLTMTKLTIGQQTRSFIHQKYPGHLSIADLLGSRWRLDIGKPASGLQCMSFLMCSLEAMPRRVELGPSLWCLRGEQRWGYPVGPCLIQREHREQELSGEHRLGQRPADQPWPNELTIQCLSLSHLQKQSNNNLFSQML